MYRRIASKFLLIKVDSFLWDFSEKALFVVQGLQGSLNAFLGFLLESLAVLRIVVKSELAQSHLGILQQLDGWRVGILVNVEVLQLVKFIRQVHALFRYTPKGDCG